MQSLSTEPDTQLSSGAAHSCTDKEVRPPRAQRTCHRYMERVRGKAVQTPWLLVQSSRLKGPPASSLSWKPLTRGPEYSLMQFQCTCEPLRIVPVQATNNSQCHYLPDAFWSSTIPRSALSLEWQSLMLCSSPKLTLCFCVLKCPRQITESHQFVSGSRRVHLRLSCG